MCMPEPQAFELGVCSTGPCFTPWHRHLVGTFGTRLRYLLDTSRLTRVHQVLPATSFAVERHVHRYEGRPQTLVELGLVEQRLKAVHEVLDGETVIDLAKRNGETRQTLQGWLRGFADQGVAGLVDRSSWPDSRRHQMSPEIEARIVVGNGAAEHGAREPPAPGTDVRVVPVDRTPRFWGRTFLDDQA